MRGATLIVCLLTLLVSTACSGMKQPLKNLGKSDIDLVSDIHIRALHEHIQELALTLYAKNPDELGKVPGLSLEERLAQILDHPTDISYRELGYKHSIAAIDLAFDRSYRGDRVFALLLGINSMLRFSYNNREELFLFDELDPQKLYNSARNLEKIAWRIRNETAHGKALIKLGRIHGQGTFEDRISRMVSIQDMMAEVIAAKTQRIVNKTVHSATSFLIPLGI